MPTGIKLTPEKPVTEIEHRGIRVAFFGRDEEWQAQIKGKPVRHSSLKVIKEAIDRTLRKPFDRIPVYVLTGDRHDRNDPVRYAPGHITNVDLRGWMYIVIEGEKTAKLFHTAFEKTEANRKRMEQIEKSRMIIEFEEKKKHDAEWALKEFDREKLRKQVLGL